MKTNEKCLVRYAKIILFVLFLTTSFHFNAYSQEVSIEKASLVAQNWLLHNKSVCQIDSIEKIFKSDTFIGYHVKLNPSGYIIIPADDILPPIKIYSFTGKYIVHGVRFEDWIEDELYGFINKLHSNKFCASGIDDNSQSWLVLLDLSYSNVFSSYESKDPLLESEWSQGGPYNKFAPLCPDDPSGHCSAGCVPVAIGQIMKYWEWPLRGRDYNEYYDSHINPPEIWRNFDDCHYDWSLIPNRLSNSNTQAQIDATAGLLIDIATAAEASFTPEGTGASVRTSATALFTFFSYHPPAVLRRYGKHYYYSDKVWYDLMKDQIDHGMPVALGVGIIDEEGGHEIVLDGYKFDIGMRQFHLNLGWGGHENAWYSLNNINTSGGVYNDVYYQDAIVNIYPDKSGYELLRYDDEPETRYGYKSLYKVSGVVDFQVGSNKSIKGVSFYSYYSNSGYTLQIFNHTNSVSNSLQGTPLYTKNGTTFGGWNYIKTSIVPDTYNESVCVALSLNDPNREEHCLLSVDDGERYAGRSYISSSLTKSNLNNLQPITENNINLRIMVNTEDVTCSPSHLNLCNSQSSCNDVGGYWYDNQCHAQPQSQCRSNNLSGCTTQTDCQNAGGYWYDLTCNASPQPVPTPDNHNAAPTTIKYALYFIVEPMTYP